MGRVFYVSSVSSRWHWEGITGTRSRSVDARSGTKL